MMNHTDTHLLDIEKLDHTGRGLGHIEGKTIFVMGALPGEQVRVRLLRHRSRFAEAEVVEVLKASPHRVPAPCPVFGRCGGCVLQHLQADQQLVYKESVLKEQLLHFGQVAPKVWLPPMNSAAWGYRSKARLGVHFWYKKGELTMGFRERSGRFLADTDRCEVLDPSVGHQLPLLKSFLGRLEIKDQIPQIEVAVDETQTCLTIRHLAPLSEADLALLRELEVQGRFRLYLQPKGKDSIHPLTPGDSKLFYTLPKYQVRIEFEPGDFTQINTALNREMVDFALSLLELKSTDRVLDLFCGLGNFTLPMARTAGEVVGVEGDVDMTKRATQNAQNNGIQNASFFADNLFEPKANAPFLQGHYQKVLLDPPRAGAQEILPYLRQLGAERVVYVSCNPATLARDLGILVHQQGFTLEAAGVLDMFPHTAHVESIAVLVK